MIKFEDGAKIYDPSEIEEYRDFELANVQEAEKSSTLSFEVPEKFTSNKDKTIYKVGFLNEFLRKVYPEKPIPDIYDIMNDKYHIFMERRSIERKIKAYLENKKYHN